TLATRTYVESLQTGSFERSVLDRVGPFDESLAVVEDLDMNTRIRKAGFQLLLDPSIRFWYLPRPRLRALWRPLPTVGLVKARILRKHPDIFKWKYVLPTAFVVAAIVAAAALFGSRTMRLAGASFFLGYAAVVIAFALVKIPRAGIEAWRLLFILP